MDVWHGFRLQRLLACVGFRIWALGLGLWASGDLDHRSQKIYILEAPKPSTPQAQNSDSDVQAPNLYPTTMKPIVPAYRLQNPTPKQLKNP